jgi:hypothetical protein
MLFAGVFVSSPTFAGTKTLTSSNNGVAVYLAVVAILLSLEQRL